MLQLRHFPKNWQGLHARQRIETPLMRMCFYKWNSHQDFPTGADKLLFAKASMLAKYLDVRFQGSLMGPYLAYLASPAIARHFHVFRSIVREKRLDSKQEESMHSTAQSKLPSLAWACRQQPQGYIQSFPYPLQIAKRREHQKHVSRLPFSTCFCGTYVGPLLEAVYKISESRKCGPTPECLAEHPLKP